MRTTAALAATLAASAALIGCSTKGSFEGRLVNGLTGQPVPSTRILLKSSDTSDLTCMTLEATSGEDGSFSVPGTCAGATYHLELPKESAQWQVTGLGDIRGGEPVGPTDVTLWEAPGLGVYYVGDETRMIRTAADLDTVTIWETEIEVRYPESIPKNVTRIDGGDYLLISGAANLKKLKFHPLIPSDARRFGTPEHYFDMDPWSYIGVKFTSDTDYEVVEATLDDSAITRVDDGDFQAWYVSGKALPPGRYALLGDADRRTYIVDFGPAE